MAWYIKQAVATGSYQRRGERKRKLDSSKQLFGDPVQELKLSYKDSRIQR